MHTLNGHKISLCLRLSYALRGRFVDMNALSIPTADLSLSMLLFSWFTSLSVGLCRRLDHLSVFCSTPSEVATFLWCP